MQYADQNDDEILRAYLRRKMSPEYQDQADDRLAAGDESRSNAALISSLSKAASAFGSVGGEQAKSTFDPSVLSGSADRGEKRFARDEARTKELYGYLEDKDKQRLAGDRLKYDQDKLIADNAKSELRRTEDMGWKQREFDQKERIEKGRLLADTGKRADEASAKMAEEERKKAEKLIADKSRVEAEQAKAMLEPRTRAANIERNANELYNLIDKYGTFESTGPESSMMDSKIYQLAIEYAKLVDPASVAREGEVATAQKYMLPVKGMFKSNKSAKEIINKFKQDAQNALATRESVLRGERPDVGFAQDTASGEAIAAPATKSIDQMDEAEIDAEIAARKGGK